MKLCSQTTGSICRQFNGIYEKAPRINQWVSRITKYKISKQKSILFLCIRNKKNQKLIFLEYIIHSSIRKYELLRGKMTKDLQNLYAKNNKTLLREMKEDLNKPRDILCLGGKDIQYS